MAQEFFIRPDIARMQNDKLGFGVDLEAGIRSRDTLPSETDFPRFIEFDLGLNASILSRPSLNPNNQQVDVYFGYFVSFLKAKTADDIQLGERPMAGKDYGALGIGVNANFEANQTFTELNVEQGAEIRYTNTANQFMPVLELSYLFVIPYRSEFREELNESNSMYQRFDARASWKIRFGHLLLRPDFRYFRSLDLAAVLKENGLDEGFHSSVSLGYVFDLRDSGPLQFFEYIYLQYNRGQFPVYLENRETIEAGISFRF